MRDALADVEAASALDDKEEGGECALAVQASGACIQIMQWRCTHHQIIIRSYSTSARLLARRVVKVVMSSRYEVGVT